MMVYFNIFYILSQREVQNKSYVRYVWRAYTPHELKSLVEIQTLELQNSLE